MNAKCKTWKIPRAEETPDWDAVPELEVSEILWLPDCGIRAFGRFCYNAESLHIRLRAVEENIRAEYTAPLSRVCEDSCLEFFFMPEGEDRYFNFEINPNGCPYIGFGRSREDRVVLYRQDAKQLFGIHTQKTPDGWEAAYRVPLSFLRLFWPDFSFTGSLRANVYKCGEQTAREHYLSWNPVSSETPDFHRPADFGVMTFA
jgi:hypothetical protein